MTTAFDPATASAVETARALAERRVSSEDLTRSALARLRTVHEASNAVLVFEDDAAIAAARAADSAIAAGHAVGPLHGVPLAHKDMFDRAGKVATWGGRIRADTPAAADATVIARLKSAGSHQIAALHLTEFAFGPTGHNYIHGHARNPYDQTRITGGSSSGSAISVSTGAVPMALGSDTAGSLRLPAAACGVKSLKGTWTRVSRAGCMPLSGLLDCVGPIARHMEDIALGFEIIAGHDPRDGLSAALPPPNMQAALAAPARGLRIAIDENLLAQAHPGVQGQIAEAKAELERAGAAFTSGHFRDWGEIDHLTQLLQLPEVASAHSEFLRTRADDYGPQVRARIEFGHFISGVDHMTAVRARGSILREVLDTVFGDCDALLLPTFADPVPTIAELDLVGGPKLMAGIARVILFTRAINYLGLPALTIPYATWHDGVPNGFQLVGRPFGEAALITLGAAYERAVPPVVAKL
ncbi:MAG: amidase [Hyphomicrobiaceae bacterium]